MYGRAGLRLGSGGRPAAGWLPSGADGKVTLTMPVHVRKDSCEVWVGTQVITRAQAAAAAVTGLPSAALYGQATVKDGRIEQSNFHDMRVVRMSEAPLLEIHIVSSKEAPGGMGEPGTAALPPAVANAIFAATGKRLRKLPIDAELLKSA